MQKPRCEADIEKYLAKKAAEAGAFHRRVQWIGRRNAPDDFLAWHVWPRGIWVECKEPGGVSTFPKDPQEEAQAREHQRMREHGEQVVLVDSYTHIDALFTDTSLD